MKPLDGRLAGRVAIVTGAGSGIGRATSLRLASEGASVVCVDRVAKGVDDVASRIESAGGSARTLCADVLLDETPAVMVALAVDAFGSLDVAHLHVGRGLHRPILDTTLAEWDAVMDLNLRATFHAMRECGKVMVAQGVGSIVVTSSGSGLRGEKYLAAYCASKHGLLGLVKVAAVEWAQCGVRVNAVCPGPIDTPARGTRQGTPELVGPDGVLSSMSPMRRAGRADEIASAVAFLASDDASFITGQALAVDGGYTVWSSGGLMDRFVGAG